MVFWQSYKPISTMGAEWPWIDLHILQVKRTWYAVYCTSLPRAHSFALLEGLWDFEQNTSGTLENSVKTIMCTWRVFSNVPMASRRKWGEYRWPMLPLTLRGLHLDAPYMISYYYLAATYGMSQLIYEIKSLLPNSQWPWFWPFKAKSNLHVMMRLDSSYPYVIYY